MSKASRRYYRTLVLGMVALAVMVWTAVDQFGITRQEMTELLLGTLWIAGGTIGLAALSTALWIGLRKLPRKLSGQDDAE